MLPWPANLFSNALTIFNIVPVSEATFHGESIGEVRSEFALRILELYLAANVQRWLALFPAPPAPAQPPVTARSHLTQLRIPMSKFDLTSIRFREKLP